MGKIVRRITNPRDENDDVLVLLSRSSIGASRNRQNARKNHNETKSRNAEFIASSIVTFHYLGERYRSPGTAG